MSVCGSALDYNQRISKRLCIFIVAYCFTGMGFFGLACDHLYTLTAARKPDFLFRISLGHASLSLSHLASCLFCIQYSLASN